MIKTKTYKHNTGCRCGAEVYHYPTNLLLENFNSPISMENRIVHLTCGGDVKHMSGYLFPQEFTIIE